MGPRRATPALHVLDSAVATQREARGFVEHGVQRAAALALDMAELEGNNAVIEHFQDTMCQLIVVDKRLHLLRSAVDEMKQQHEREMGGSVEDLSKMFEERMDSIASTIAAFEPRQDQRFLDLQRNITAMNTQVTEKGGEEEMQEDVVISQAEQILTCPLTTELMKRPMRNKKCQHVYEESAIRAVIERQRRKRRVTKCPVVGCDNMDIHVEDLEIDPVLLHTIESRRRQESSS